MLSYNCSTIINGLTGCARTFTPNLAGYATTVKDRYTVHAALANRMPWIAETLVVLPGYEIESSGQ